MAYPIFVAKQKYPEEPDDLFILFLRVPCIVVNETKNTHNKYCYKKKWVTNVM